MARPGGLDIQQLRGTVVVLLHWQVVGHKAPEMRNVVSTNSPSDEVRWVGWILNTQMLQL